MLNLEEILDQWQEDCEIPRDRYELVSQETPKLHAKYLQYLSLTRLQLKRAEHAQKTLLKDKWLYYNGKMSQEELGEQILRTPLLPDGKCGHGRSDDDAQSH